MNNQQQTSLFRQDTQKLFLSVMFAVCLVSFFGTSGGNLSGSVGQSKGSSDRQWVDNASSIVGTESVDIDVDGKLKMEGSLIANIDKDGKDGGNLDIKAGSIEAKDLQNFDNNKETGFNLAESYGPPKDGSNDGHPNGTTTIGLKNKGYEKEGVTKATIGQGNIEVADGSDISGINRDIDNMDVITKDQITGALDATVTVDNRIITGSFSEWWNDVFNKNAKHYDEKNELAQNYFKDNKGNPSSSNLSLLPTAGTSPSYVGRETFDHNDPTKLTSEFIQAYGGRTPEQLTLKEKLFSTFDVNPLFKFVNSTIPGMNAMAVFHDKMADKGVMSDSPWLQTSILPAIPTTYMGLLFGGTANDLGLDIKTNNMYQQSTDRMSATPVPSNLNEYMEQQKNELQQLKDKYTR